MISQYRKNIILDYVHTFFRNVNITMGIWMVYLQIRGFNLIEIAVFEIILHITSLLLEIPTGIIADVIGRKVSRILGVLSYFAYIYILLESQDFLIVAIGFVFCGLSYTLESGAAEALVYDSLVEMEQEDQFMKVTGRKEVIYQSSSFAALLVAGTIANVSYELTFIITGVFFLFALITIILMTEVKVKNKVKQSLKESLKQQFIISSQIVFRSKRLFFLIVIGALMTAPITTIFFYLQNHLYNLGYNIALITVLIGLHAGASAIGGYFAHKIEKRYGEKKILLFIPMFIMICFWLMLVDQIIFVPFIMLGFFDSIFYVVLIDYINKIVSSNIRATVVSFFGMAVSVVMIVIFLIVGIIGELSNLRYGIMALAIIVTVIYIWLFPVLSGRKTDRVE